MDADLPLLRDTVAAFLADGGDARSTALEAVLTDPVLATDPFTGLAVACVEVRGDADRPEVVVTLSDGRGEAIVHVRADSGWVSHGQAGIPTHEFAAAVKARMGRPEVRAEIAALASRRALIRLHDGLRQLDTAAVRARDAWVASQVWAARAAGDHGRAATLRRLSDGWGGALTELDATADRLAAGRPAG